MVALRQRRRAPPRRSVTPRSATTTHKAPGNLPSAAGSFVEIDISADSADHPSWKVPVKVHFRRIDSGWKLVGLQRLP